VRAHRQNRLNIGQRSHDNGRPADRRFVGLSSDAKVNFLAKAPRSDTLETLECVTALSFFAVAWYFTKAKPHKSAVLIIAVTVRKRNFPQNALHTSQYKRYVHSKTVRAPQRLKSIGHGQYYHPFSFFRTASRPFATL
jgi:hypothetical protein